MMRKLLSGLIAAALLLAGCARADENFDTMTCAQYTELSKKPGVDAGFVWAQEYVRTMNKEYGRGETMLSVSDQRALLRGYCGVFGSRSFVDGVKYLWLQESMLPAWPLVPERTP